MLTAKHLLSQPAEAEAIDEPATSAAEDGVSPFEIHSFRSLFDFFRSFFKPVREQEKEEASKTNDSAVEDASEQPVVPDPEVAMDQTKDPHVRMLSLSLGSSASDLVLF